MQILRSFLCKEVIFQMSEKKHLVCSKPFTWFEATERDGVSNPVYLCCSGWLPLPAGDLRLQSPLEIWRSEPAKRIRKSVVDGSFKHCKEEFCRHLAEASWPVHYVDDEGLKRYQEKVENPDNPIHLNCSYDKSCNLSCPSCRTNLVMAKGKERQAMAEFGKELIDELADTLDLIYITGSGDPFASKHYLDILTSGKLEAFPHLKVYLHTNAQLFTEETWNKLKLSQEKIHVLEVSIDGASKPTYEDNRRPGKWEVLKQNMEFLATLKKQNRIKHFQISFVVQANNFREMNEFIKLGKEWSVDHVLFSTLNNWSTFSPSEYAVRAVHRPTHREHTALLEELKKIDTSDPIVQLGYFTELLDRFHQGVKVEVEE